MVQTTIRYTPRHKLHTAILKLCHKMELPLHYNVKGPKVFTNYQRVGLIILFLRSKKALRDFIKELYESLWPKWLGLKAIPGKSTLHDWINLFTMPILRLLNKTILGDEHPKIMAMDGTGIDSWQRSRHYEKRIQDHNMPYAKLDVLIDTEKMLIHDFILKIKPRHDILGAKSMIKRFKHKNTLILGDKGYDSEELHELVAKSGNKFFAPVRDFKVKKPKGKFRKRCINGNEKYSRRNTVESLFHSIKSRMVALRSRKSYMKKREMAWQVIRYNIEKISGTVSDLIKLILNQLFRTSPYYDN